jgi:type VI secretion system secreted protein Hcp
MAIALYMKVDGATGESKNKGFEDQTEIMSFHWGVSQPTTIGYGGGGGAGKASFADLTVHAPLDKVYPAVFIKSATGVHIPTVLISGAKAGGDSFTYFTITLTDCLVTSCNVSGADGAEVSIDYSFQAAKVKSEYFMQNKDGTKGAGSDFTYDIKGAQKV